MSCGGCSGAVERVLKRLEGMYFRGFLSRAMLIDPAGVKSFDVNLETQTALVTAESTVPYDTVLAAIKKTGKQVNSGEADGQTMSV